MCACGRRPARAPTLQALLFSSLNFMLSYHLIHSFIHFIADAIAIVARFPDDGLEELEQYRHGQVRKGTEFHKIENAIIMMISL